MKKNPFYELVKSFLTPAELAKLSKKDKEVMKVMGRWIASRVNEKTIRKDMW